MFILPAGKSGLTLAVVAPARDLVIRTHRTTVVVPHAQLGEDPEWGRFIHGAPTGDSPLVVDSAGLPIPGTDGDERARRRIRLTLVVVPPACQSPIRIPFKPRVKSYPAGVKLTRTDGF